MMPALHDEPAIISMAHALGIHEGNQVESIKDYCRKKVARLISGVEPIRTIEELERVVCEKLNLTIVEVWSDGDLDDIVERYGRQEKTPAFAYLHKDLDDETFATLLCCRRRPADTEDRYVAVVDCRGGKAARRFFTRWHEIAHILTLIDQLEFPLHRSTVKKNPVEKMMDIIAGDIGFFAPLFQPILNERVTRDGFLTFAGVISIRNTFCSTASFESTLNACANRLMTPVVILQVALGYKRSEERAMNSPQEEFFPVKKPEAQPRVVKTMSNDVARGLGLLIPQNMRVPKASIISTVFDALAESEALAADENLNLWRSSKGGALRHGWVHVEAMKVADRVWVILTSLEGQRAARI